MPLLHSPISISEQKHSKTHNLGTEKEWSFHSPFHLCKGFLPPFVQHRRWRKTKVALCSASSEGQTVKVGNSSSPFHFKYIFAPMGRVSTTTPLLSGHLLYDFQVKMEEEKTQLEEVDIYSPPQIKYPVTAACHNYCVCARACGVGGNALSGLICEFCLLWLLGS